MSQFLIRYSTKYLNSKFNSEFQNSLKIWQTKHFLILLKSKVDLLCSDKQFQPTQNVTWKNVSKKMKSYLHCKTITTEHVSSEEQVYIFSSKAYVLFSRYLSSCIFNHPLWYQIFNIMARISTWDKVHFLIDLLNHNSFINQTWVIDRYN